MRMYEVDLMIANATGRTARDTICTVEKASEREAIRYAIGIMKLQNRMLDAETFFVYRIVRKER